MPVAFRNFEFSYLNKKGKPVFVPSDDGRTIGEDVRKRVAAAVDFPEYYRHFQPGGHVAALHAHREHEWFARVDLQNFFYTVARNRVSRALKAIAIDDAVYAAKWSTVRSPYAEHGYVLPYGFVQSPILATLAMVQSALGTCIETLSQELTTSVFLDDICLSSDDPVTLQAAFGELTASIAEAGFTINPDKTHPPANSIHAFNCVLEQQRTEVLEERRAEFYAEERSKAGVEGFERYCDQVAEGNA